MNKTGLEVLLARIEDGHSLEHYAAHAAAKVLVENWVAALRDGTDINKLVGDVDDVIHQLSQFKDDVQHSDYHAAP